MKTLSDDITFKMPTTDMSTGYIKTTIYANGIGVFSGHSYIPGDDSSLYVNVNDIAAQNSGQNDFIKLNDDGEVDTIELKTEIVQTTNTSYRFVKGKVGTFGVHITDDTHTYLIYEDVLCGYDYENKYLLPSFIEDETNSSLCRIMQGCNWIYNPSEKIGTFNNLLLPHLPYIQTKKYGLGLQIWRNGTFYLPEYLNTKFSIRLTTGTDFELGCPIFVTSNMTYVSLYDFLNGVNTSYGPEYNSSIYLKLSGTSGDEFGDYEEGYTMYKGHVNLEAIQVSGFKDGVETDLGTFEEGATFRVYVNRYIGVSGADWKIAKLMDGDREVYSTDWNTERIVDAYMDDYEAEYRPMEIPRSSIAEIYYDYLIATPIFNENKDEMTYPDKFIGTCPVAVLDECYSRYYLAWYDRYGDVQSQAFDGKAEYTEDIETEEIIDYKNRRRVSRKSVQPKWKLNTKWLPENIYPMYESIYTSPYLLLYDTQQDKAWNVILKDSNYKEKTFKTEKSLFNLELNVEANTKQNHIF